MGLFKDVASVVSPIIGSAADLWGGMQSNKLAASNAQANRDFQEYMASNAHQLEVQDLRKAGLNPILSANAGATASGGANAAFVNPAQGVSSGLNSAAQLLQQQNLVKAQTDQMRSLADKNASDASVAQATLPFLAEQIRTQRTQQQANSAVAAYNTAQLGVLPAIIQREMATAARYCLKKLEHRIDEYEGLVPEYVTMSRRPGIGRGYYELYKDDLFNYDVCVVDNGFLCKPPLRYDEWLAVDEPTRYGVVKLGRILAAKDIDELTLDRLMDLEHSLRVRTKSLKRNFEAEL